MSDLPAIVFRVDPRLVHATLMNAWVPAVQAQWILLADAQVLGDERRRTIYEMSAGEAAHVYCVAEPGVAAKLADLRDAGPGIVLFSSLGSVLRAMRGGLAVDVLNVGHVPAGPGRSEVHPAVYLGSGDLEMLRQLESVGVLVRIQALPDDVPIRVDLSPGSSGPSSSGSFRAPTPTPAHAEGDEDLDEVGPRRVQTVLEVVNERGLHLRAAHVLAALCNELPTTVKIGRQGEMVNAKSLLGLTTLGAARGSRLTVIVEGERAEEAMERLRRLFELGFHEGVEADA